MVKTITYENCIVRVHIPEITDDERAKRRKQFIEASAKFMMQVEKERKKA